MKVFTPFWKCATHTHTHALTLMLVFMLIGTMTNAQTPIEYEIPLHEIDRVKEVPCTKYTEPESTINYWNWQKQDFEFYYDPGDGTVSHRYVVSPFHSVNKIMILKC